MGFGKQYVRISVRPVRVFVWTTIFVIASVGTGLGVFPRLEIVYPPASRFECSSEKIPILGRAQCTDCSLLVGNHAVGIEKDGFFSTDVELLPGENKVDVYLRDAGGNEYLQTLLVTRNVPAPGVTELESTANAPVAPETPPAAFATPIPASRKWTEFAPDYRQARQRHSNSVGKPNVSKPRNIKRTPAAVADKPAVEFYFDGKQAAAPGRFLLKQNHIYLPADSSIWTEGGASVGGGGTVIFGSEGPIKPQTIEAGGLENTLIKEDGRVFLPVRAIFERGGRSVQWEAGRVYIAKQYRPCPIDLPGKPSGEKLVGIVYRDMLFVRTSSLSEIGIKVEEKAGRTRLTGRDGKWMSLGTGRSSGGDLMVELASGKSPPKRITAPAADVADSDYIVPFRRVLTEFGFTVEWNGDRKAVSVAPATVAARF